MSQIMEMIKLLKHNILLKSSIRSLSKQNCCTYDLREKIIENEKKIENIIEYYEKLEEEYGDKISNE